MIPRSMLTHSGNGSLFPFASAADVAALLAAIVLTMLVT